MSYLLFAPVGDALCVIYLSSRVTPVVIKIEDVKSQFYHNKPTD